MRNVPRRLYKFQAFTTLSLANLKNRTLWFSQPSRFNDPFDCRLRLDPDDIDDEELLALYRRYRAKQPDPAVFDRIHFSGGKVSESFKKQVLSATRTAFSERVNENSRNRGVCCFSEAVDDLLMWSHYTDGHRGFCLEFDTQYDPFSKALPVQYTETVPTLSIAQAIMDPEHNGFIQMVTTKSSHWSYEREWRILHMEPDKAYTYPWQALTGVYWGAAMEYAHKEIIAMILRGSPTKLHEVSMDDRSFGLEIRDVEYTPFTYVEAEHGSAS